MGVNGLWALLTPVARPVNLDALERKRLAIDASIWLYQFQMVMRDRKSGDVLKGAHVMGTFRRIMKLVYHGIRPVFVFDGKAPSLKKRTIEQRRKRKQGAGRDATRTAQLLLSAQLRAAAAEAALRRRTSAEDASPSSLPVNTSTSGRSDHRQDTASSRYDTGDLIDENATYLEDLDAGLIAPSVTAQPNKQVPGPTTLSSASPSVAAGRLNAPLSAALKKHVLRDEYALPSLEGSLESRIQASDARLATEAEQRDFFEEMRPEFFDSEEFACLSTQLKYEIIGEQRLKSRQVNHRRVQQMKTLPSALDFSQSQIANLVVRNQYTQKLLEVTDELGQAAIQIPTRVAGERNRVYQLIKQDPSQGPGYVLAVKNPELTSNEPITIDTTSDESDEATDSDEFEEVVASAPPCAPPFDLEARRARALEAIRARQNAQYTLVDDDPYLDAAPAMGGAMLFEFDRAENVDASTSSLSSDDDEQHCQFQTAIHESSRKFNASVDLGHGTLSQEPERNESQNTHVSGVSRWLPRVDDDPEDESSSDGESIRLHERFNLPFTEHAASGRAIAAEAGDSDDYEEVEIDSDRHADRSVNASLSLLPRPLADAPTVTLSSTRRSFLTPEQNLDRTTSTHLPFAPEVASLPAHLPSGKQPTVDTSKEADPVDSDPSDPSSSRVADETLAKDRRVASEPVAWKTRHVVPEGQQQSYQSKVDRHESDQIDTAMILADHAVVSAGDAPFALGRPGGSKPGSSREVALPDQQVSMRVSDLPDPRTGNGASDSEPEDFFEWERSPTPVARPGQHDDHAQIWEDLDASDAPGGLKDLPSSDDDDGAEDAAIANLRREQDQYADMLSQLKNRRIEDMRDEARADVATLSAQRNTDQRNADGITRQMETDIKELLSLFGLPYVDAPQEAEAECADLHARKLVDGIVTDDSDVFLFGGAVVYRNMFNDDKFIECYLLADLDRELGLDRKKLVRLAYLLGSDYTEGLAGIGPVLGRELLEEFPGDDGLRDFKAWWMKVQNGKDGPADISTAWRRKFKKAHKDLVLEESWPASAIAKAYLAPVVSRDDEPFEWGSIDLDGVRAFLARNLSWGSQKVDGIMLPLLSRQKARAEGTLRRQGFISEFFDVSVGTGPLQRQHRRGYASSRLQSVLNQHRSKNAASSQATSHELVKVDSPEPASGVDEASMSEERLSQPRNSETRGTKASRVLKAKKVKATESSRKARATGASHPSGASASRRAPPPRTADTADSTNDESFVNSSSSASVKRRQPERMARKRSSIECGSSSDDDDARPHRNKKSRA